MYEIIKNVILSGNFELTDILSKIDTLWVQGGLTNVQRLALIDMARGKADPRNSFAPLQVQIDALAERIAKLEGQKPSEDHPQFVQPTGSHDAYRAGDTVTFNGKQYTCIAPEGVAVVWSPEVYPSYWEELA